MPEKKNKKKAEDASGTSEKPSSSEKKTPKSLKPERKIEKRTPSRNILKANVAAGAPQIPGVKGKQNERSQSSGKEGTSKAEKHDAEKPKSEEKNYEKQMKKDQAEKNKDECQEAKRSQSSNGEEGTGRAEKHDAEKPKSKERNKEKNYEKQMKKDQVKKNKDECQEAKKSQSSGEEGTSRAEKHDAEKPKSKERNKEKNHEKQMKKGQAKKNKDEFHESEKSLKNQNDKEKLGGLIFMCSAKTKPDCFHYRVMGVSTSKKDLVLGVKPGLKLFLYDFDLRLMYGIYKASSSGGMKLEPKAFDGAFPVQVRFTVHMDCYPLPENIFKKAIKDNYDRCNKFKAELSIEQVKKLVKLFQSAKIHPQAMSMHSPPRARERDREVHRGEREYLRHPHCKPLLRDPDTIDNTRRYSTLSHDRHQPTSHRRAAPTRSEELPHDAFMSEQEYRTYGLRGTSSRGDVRSYQPLIYKEVASPRVKELPQDSFMSEKEYRIYGLQRPSRNMTPPAHEQEHVLRQQAPVGQEHIGRDPLFVNGQDYQIHGLQARQGLPANPYTTVVERGYLPKDNASMHGEPLSVHTFINEGEYRTSHIGGRHESPYSIPAGTMTTASAYPRDPYYATCSGVTVDTYPPPSRSEADTLDRIYSTYASGSSSRFDQEARPKCGHVPVSSLYSFAGPSMFRP